MRTTIKHSLLQYNPIELQQVLERAVDLNDCIMGDFQILDLHVLEIGNDFVVFKYRDNLSHTTDWSKVHRITRQTLVEQERLIAAHGTFGTLYGEVVMDGIDWRFGTWYADRQAAITNLLNALAD